MNKNYKKNPYYTNEDIKKAVKLADDFYNKKYRPQLLRSGNKNLVLMLRYSTYPVL